MANISSKLAHTKAGFERVRKAQQAFVSSLPSLRRVSGTRSVAVDAAQQERLCEMSFVVLFTAWERFVESAFEWYVVDAPLAAFRRHHRVLVTDVETARDLIRGSRKYVEWASPELVRERARVFFRGGEPFESAISSISDDLMKMQTIRNRCVHYSHHATEQYEKMVRQVFGSRRHIAPGGLLLGSPPTGISTITGASGYGSVFEFYGEVLSTACCQIVPEKRR